METSGWLQHEYNLGFFLYYRKSVKISSELCMCFSYLGLAPSNFWVDEPQEISSDVVPLKPKLKLRKKLFISRPLLDRFR